MLLAGDQNVVWLLTCLVVQKSLALLLPEPVLLWADECCMLGNEPFFVTNCAGTALAVFASIKLLELFSFIFGLTASFTNCALHFSLRQADSLPLSMVLGQARQQFAQEVLFQCDRDVVLLLHKGLFLVKLLLRDVG